MKDTVEFLQGLRWRQRRASAPPQTQIRAKYLKGQESCVKRPRRDECQPPLMSPAYCDSDDSLEELSLGGQGWPLPLARVLLYLPKNTEMMKKSFNIDRSQDSTVSRSGRDDDGSLVPDYDALRINRMSIVLAMSTWLLINRIDFSTIKKVIISRRNGRGWKEQSSWEKK